MDNLSQNHLSKLGLTNRETLDIAEYTTHRGYISIATCNSPKCGIASRFSSHGVIKSANLSATNCPDCGHALFWRQTLRKEQAS